jgi:CheY-like chemotaxis protein
LSFAAYALAARVRAGESADQHLPILALTASAMPDEAERCSHAGMDALLVKPAGMAELRKALYRWMPATADTAAAQAVSAQEVSPIEALTGLFGPSARVGELIGGFLATARDDLARFDEAMRADDAAAIAGHIHRINGAIKIFGAATLADEGERIRAAVLRQGHADGKQEALREYRRNLAGLIDTLRQHQDAAAH